MCSVIGLLDQRCIDVDPALELAGAGPPARAFLLALADGAGARDAADRRVARVVQRVVRNLVDVHIGVDALGVPVGERLDLPDPVALAPLHLPRAGAGRALLAADARDPGVIAGERPLERLDPPGRAATIPIGLPEPVDGGDRRGAPPSSCPPAARGEASRAGSPRRAGHSRD